MTSHIIVYNQNTNIIISKNIQDSFGCFDNRYVLNEFNSIQICILNHVNLPKLLKCKVSNRKGLLVNVESFALIFISFRNN